MNKIMMAVSMLLLIALGLSAVSCDRSVPDPKDSERNTETERTEEPDYTVSLVPFDGTVDFHTPEQAAYLMGAAADIKTYVSTLPQTDRSAPQTVVLRWSAEPRNGGEVLYPSYTVFFGTSAGLTGAAEFKTRNTEYRLTNLLLGTTYYWKVRLTADGKDYESPVGSFTTTSQCPRNLFVDGVTNCRDLGGYKTADGKTVRQGLLFRTGKLSKTSETNITLKGIRTMTEELGVKTEIDLRNGTSEIRETSVLPGVKVVNLGCSGANMVKLDPLLPEIFEVLADESNYPVFFHCAIGTDRTGALAYLILELLGVSDEDIHRDYCFSNFGDIFSSSSTESDIRVIENLYSDPDPDVIRVGQAVNAAKGFTRKEKVRNYLKSVGVSDETLDAVISILLE